VWLEPAATPRWRTAHPTLATLAADAGERRRGRALPAGPRPALALQGPDLTETTQRVVERLGAYSDAASSTK
jgi:hypothetical protein